MEEIGFHSTTKLTRDKKSEEVWRIQHLPPKRQFYILPKRQFYILCENAFVRALEGGRWQWWQWCTGQADLQNYHLLSPNTLLTGSPHLPLQVPEHLHTQEQPLGWAQWEEQEPTSPESHTCKPTLTRTSTAPRPGAEPAFPSGRALQQGTCPSCRPLDQRVTCPGTRHRGFQLLSLQLFLH